MNKEFWDNTLHISCSPFTEILSDEKCKECGEWFGDHSGECEIEREIKEEL